MRVSESTEQWQPSETPIVILAEGCFGNLPMSKLAMGVIRYGNWPIAAIIDSTKAGKTAQDVTDVHCSAPIVASLQDALRYKPKALLIGTAPAGGSLPSEWRVVLAEAIQQGLHIINGLHFFLNEEPDLVKLAQQHQVKLWDVRDPEAYGHHKFQEINHQKDRPADLRVITMVGTDCSVGKMHTALELNETAQKQHFNSAFIATGQTGILITGKGVPLDRVIGDFMAGSMEVCIQEEIQQHESLSQKKPLYLFIEGQGSLLHPAYSGVTLSLLHGSNPDAMILCHKANNHAINHYPHLNLPPLGEIISMYESAAAWVRPLQASKAKVMGIAVNTSMISEDEAQAYLQQIQDETGLPATDPVRYGVQTLLDALTLSPVQA